jgi:hypothetical protein
MDHAEDDGGGNGDDVFIYMGDDQRVPEDVTHVRVHKSVKTIRGAFNECIHLVSIEMHDGVEIIEWWAFYNCTSLRGIKLPGVRVIGKMAFRNCTALENVEFGDKLETIAGSSFLRCTSLRNIKITKVGVIESGAFSECEGLVSVELSKDLQRIGYGAFWNCPRLRMVSIPLKANMVGDNVFRGCDSLSQVDLVGGIHKTISSLLLGSWRNEMKDIIGQINRDLPNTPTNEIYLLIRRWMGRVTERIEHYKSEHYALLKMNMTQLELALWDANLPNVDAAASRHEARVTCGANIIIPHVLSFLNDIDEFPLLDYGQL